jgi:integrase
MMHRVAADIEKQALKTSRKQRRFVQQNCCESNRLALGFAPPGDETFTAVAKRFLAYQKARLTPKAYDRERSIIELHIQPFFPCRLSSVRRVDIQRYVTLRSAKVSAHTVQKELNILKHLLRLAVEWEIIPFHPSQGIKSPRVPAGRVRYLQPAELWAIIEASPAWLRPIIAIAVSKGMRRSEVLGLRWLDLDLVHDRIMLSQTKNGESRIVYLNKLLRQPSGRYRLTLAPSQQTSFLQRLLSTK